MDRPSKHRVFYDSDCPFCVRQVNWLARLDWAGRFRWVPASSPEGIQLAARLAPGALAAAVHCVSPTHSVCQGARCLRWVALRLPLLAPFALVLWLPGMLPLAEAGYRWVARNRHRWNGSPTPSTRCDCPRPGPAAVPVSSGLPNPRGLP